MLSHCHCPQLTRYYGSYVVDSSLWIVMEYLEVREGDASPPVWQEALMTAGG